MEEKLRETTDLLLSIKEAEDDYVEVAILLQKITNPQTRLNALLIDRFF